MLATLIGRFDFCGAEIHYPVAEICIKITVLGLEINKSTGVSSLHPLYLFIERLHQKLKGRVLSQSHGHQLLGGEQGL